MWTVLLCAQGLRGPQGGSAFRRDTQKSFELIWEHGGEHLWFGRCCGCCQMAWKHGGELGSCWPLEPGRCREPKLGWASEENASSALSGGDCLSPVPGHHRAHVGVVSVSL